MLRCGTVLLAAQLALAILPPGAQGGTGAATLHVDNALRFSVERPQGLLVVHRKAAALTRFAPAPFASVLFARPIGGPGGAEPMEPPDLEVRVFDAGAGASLEEWLARVRITSEGTTVRSCRSAGASGLRVCQTTMVFPDCSCFFLRGGHVYQLTPASAEGEAMLESFAILP